MAALDGDFAAAEKLDAELRGLHAGLFIESNPIPAKWAVQRLGYMGKGIRLPLTWFSEQYQEQVESAMKQAGVL